MRGDRPIRARRSERLDKFTPHARGSTCYHRRCSRCRKVYPACAGIDQLRTEEDATPIRLPRMRGDRPAQDLVLDGHKMFTPHARGSTRGEGEDAQAQGVYPACAGIDHHFPWADICRTGLPRMRGDRPKQKARFHHHPKFTPHARGSTPAPSSLLYHMFVYPACAGIDLYGGLVVHYFNGLPRMRGDRPDLFSATWDDVLFTPHARGSTRQGGGFKARCPVYPACAGIDLPLI